MSYIGQGLPADSFQGFTTDSFTGDGSATTFTLSKKPFDESALLVVINNVVQKPTTNFTVSGTTLTIVGTAVASGDVIYATHIGGALPIGQAASVDLNGASDQFILDADADTTISADTDDQIDFKLGGTDFMSLTTTGATISMATAGDNLTLKSTNSGAEAGPQLILYRESSSPADGDVIGRVRFEGEDDASNKTVYAQFTSSIVDAGDGSGGSEDSNFQLEVFNNGALRQIFDINGGTSGQGEIVFNQPNQDMNFVIESSGLSNAFVVDAGTDAVGIGTASPSPFRLLVDSDSSNNGIAKFNHSDATPEGIRIIYSAAAPDNTSTNFVEIQDSSALRLQILGDGDVKNHDGVYTSISSDERLKSNIVDANSQWNDIKAIKFRNFKKKDDIEKYGDDAWTLLGVIAQEAEEVTPKLVQNRNPYAEEIKLNSVFGTLYEDGDTIPEGKEIGDVKEVKEQVKTFKDSILFWKCAKALQEAMTRIETLETKVKALEDA